MPSIDRTFIPHANFTSFRQVLACALFLSDDDRVQFDAIPDQILDNIFTHNFNGNLRLAERVLLNRYNEIDRIDSARLETEKHNIHNYRIAVKNITHALSNYRPVLFITDNDNDGSLAQAVLMEFVQALPESLRSLVHIEYAQPIGSTRGINYEIVDKAVAARGWIDQAEFLIVSADNGINNRVEQKRIQARWPNSQLLITDHHLPVPDQVILENERSLIFNPKYRPTTYFQQKNISGANTLGVLLVGAIKELVAQQQPVLTGSNLSSSSADSAETTSSVANDSPRLSLDQQKAIAHMEEIGRWANLLDYANSSMADMPTRPYTMEKALQLRPLLNISNSMSNLVTGNFSASELSGVMAVIQQQPGVNNSLLSSMPPAAKPLSASGGPDPASPSVTGASDDLAISSTWLSERLADIHALNQVAHKLLNFYHANKTLRFTYSESDFYTELSKHLVEPLDSYQSINPNYIEQLRPIIFNLSAIDGKDIFQTLMVDTMLKVFEDLKQQEAAILTNLRSVFLLNQHRAPYSTVLYPLDPSITKFFNRKLLGKGYNNSLNGFQVIFNELSATEARGSMRSLYDMSDLLLNKKFIEQQLHIEISFQGHERAAGFFIKSTKGRLTKDTLSKFNDWMSHQVQALKASESANQIPTLSVNFTNLRLINKINRLIKANLSGMHDLPVVLQLSPNQNAQVWVTDGETTKQITLEEVVQTKRFGYQSIQTDFHGQTIVVPVEQLRSVVESNYQKVLRLGCVDDGVLFSSRVVDPQDLPRLTPLPEPSESASSLAKYYRETFSASNFIPLHRSDFVNIPYFKYNRYGVREFANWESVIIGFLDRTHADVLAVIDTEATGLGRAPKCFNIGGTNLEVDPASGVTLPADEFEARCFRDAKGNRYVLTPAQLASLLPQDDSDASPSISNSANSDPVSLNRFSLSLSPVYRLTGTQFNSTISTHNNELFSFFGKATDLEPIDNFAYRTSLSGSPEVVLNRRLRGFAFSFLVNNNDFAITKDFEDLTGISNALIDSLGKSATSVDKTLTNYFTNLKNSSGHPAKVIFQAHNLPYDQGVIDANFQEFSELMAHNLTSDTAKIARQRKLAYDDTPVCSFAALDPRLTKTYFYDSPYSDYSMSTFLGRCAKGKGGVFPDISSDVLLKFNPDNEHFSLIDRKLNQEIDLPNSLEEFLHVKKTGELPNNAIKFSVESLSLRAMVRNIILFDQHEPACVPLTTQEEPFQELLEFFQKNYHFDSTINRNLTNFYQALSSDPRLADLRQAVDLPALATRFLDTNKAIQAKFHDGWIYAKVLSHYEPSLQSKRVPKEIIEQVNYFTDLPNRKIKQVFNAVIDFKRHFNLTHALVHEQHNNIRQTSSDGQGMSDTTYESVLPQLLCMMKDYNPYNRSIASCVNHLVEHNIEGAMVQSAIKNYTSSYARDSYSVSQMLAFNRTHKTASVKKVQQLVNHGREAELTVSPTSADSSATSPLPNQPLLPVSFKLPTGILPPNTNLVAQPKVHVPQADIKAMIEQLVFTMVNEQTKEAVLRTRDLNPTYAENMIELLGANEPQLQAIRTKLLAKFSRWDFARDSNDLHKVCSLLQQVAKGEKVKVPKVSTFSAEVLTSLQSLTQDIAHIAQDLGVVCDVDNMDAFLTDLINSSASQKVKNTREKFRDLAKTSMQVSESHRTADFLPTIDVRRQEPLKFMLKTMGFTPILAYFRPAIPGLVLGQSSSASPSLAVPAAQPNPSENIDKAIDSTPPIILETLKTAKLKFK